MALGHPVRVLILTPLYLHPLCAYVMLSLSDSGTSDSAAAEGFTTGQRDCRPQPTAAAEGGIQKNPKKLSLVFPSLIISVSCSSPVLFLYLHKVTREPVRPVHLIYHKRVLSFHLRTGCRCSEPAKHQIWGTTSLRAHTHTHTEIPIPMTWYRRHRGA